MVEISDGAIPAAALLMDNLVARGNACTHRWNDAADPSAESYLEPSRMRITEGAVDFEDGQSVRELCRQSLGLIGSPDRSRPCRWLLFLTGLNQAAVAVGSKGIGGVNPKVFRDRRPLCDLQKASTPSSLTIFRRSNRPYDRSRNSNR
jgi:hypothetical protein